MPATAGSVTLTTSEVDLYNTESTLGVTSFVVTCDADAGADALINVPGLHEEDEWFPLAAGESQIFRLQTRGLGRVRAKSASSTVLVRFGVVAKV